MNIPEAQGSRQAMAEVAQVSERASASSCFGTAVSAGDRTVIPVADVSYGFGFGFGGGTDTSERNDGDAPTSGFGGGGGAGARTRGIAVIEVAPDGVRIHPVYDQTAITLAGITLATTAAAVASRTLLKLIRG